MPNTKDWKPGAKLDILVIAAYKTGKTFGALSFPRPNVIDFDGGMAVANHPEFIKKYGKKSIEYQTFFEKDLDSRGIVKSHNAIDDACRYFDMWMKPGKREQFDTWVIDSGTSLSKFASNKAIVYLSPDSKTSLGITSNTHKHALASGIIVPKKQDYGAERSIVEQFIQMVKTTDKHCVVLCHEMERTNDEGQLTAVLPLLTGKSQQVVPTMFDEVYFLRIRPKGPDWERYLQTESDGIRKCGSRLGLPNATAWDFETIQKALATVHK